MSLISVVFFLEVSLGLEEPDDITQMLGSCQAYINESNMEKVPGGLSYESQLCHSHPHNYQEVIVRLKRETPKIAEATALTTTGAEQQFKDARPALTTDKTLRLINEPERPRLGGVVCRAFRHVCRAQLEMVFIKLH